MKIKQANLDDSDLKKKISFSSILHSFLYLRQLYLIQLDIYNIPITISDSNSIP